MDADDSEELVAPTGIHVGDVIEDPVGRRWLDVREVKVLTTSVTGAYSFFGNGPDDRVTFEGHERVKRRRRSTV